MSGTNYNILYYIPIVSCNTYLIINLLQLLICALCTIDYIKY